MSSLPHRSPRPDADPASPTAPAVLEAGGFRASADAFALQEPPEGGVYQQWLWCVSLLGPQQAVKALWARLLKGELATLSREAMRHPAFCRLAPEGPKSWRFYTASLPGAGGYQGVLVPEVALFTSEREDFLLLARRAEELPALHCRFLNRRLDLPLHPAWRDWLWTRALRTGEASALAAVGLLAYRCLPDPAALASEVGDALRRGLLPLADAAQSAVASQANNRWH